MTTKGRRVSLLVSGLFGVSAAIVGGQSVLNESTRLADSKRSALPVAQRNSNQSDLRNAVLCVLSNSCGNSIEDAWFRAQLQIVHEAGPAIVQILPELVADRDSTEWLIGNACGIASRFPFSPTFREAVRSRRDKLRIPVMAVPDYFAQFGDESDLTWLESVLQRADSRYEKEVTIAIERLRLRLARK